MPRPSYDETTLAPPGGRARDALAAKLRGPALTIAGHVDLRRVGERADLPALLAGEAVEISRRGPMFRDPTTLGAGEPLADPYLSRKPTTLRGLPGGRIEVIPNPAGPTVHVDGKGLTEPCVLDRAALAAGRSLTLGERVVLWLHEADALPHRPLEDHGLLGGSDAIRDLRQQIAQVADVSVPVLVRGESGSGKELVAAALHATSGRSGAFVSVNMAAVPAQLAASELFGHGRGAFSGADKDQPGYFDRADGGTLFLDEIGASSDDVQAMLLRVLETGETQPVGARRPRRVDVRLVAATDADLEAAVAEGRFREPLLHRLAGYDLRVAPLRDRRDDVPRLFAHFLVDQLTELDEVTRVVPDGPIEAPWLPTSLIEHLLRHDWPGNVRELRNIARQTAIAGRGQTVVPVDRVLARLASGPDAVEAPPPAARMAPADIDEDELLRVLEAHEWQLGPTAKSLGIARNTLNSIIERCPRVRRPKDLAAAELSAASARLGDDLRAMSRELRVSLRGLKLRMKELGLR